MQATEDKIKEGLKNRLQELTQVTRGEVRW